jgi:branched-chain amino acid transport system ATP-binding protein
LILLDEPLEGLALIIVVELLVGVARVIREEGLSAILIGQNAQKILGITDRAMILERGSIVHAGESASLKADRAVLETYLGVTDAGPRRAIKTAPPFGVAGREYLRVLLHAGVSVGINCAGE